MTLLIHLLFLGIAADVLYEFPYRLNTESLQEISVIAISYIQWLALDIGIVWIFAIAALHWPILNHYYSSSNGHRADQKTLIELMLPHQDVAYFITSDKTNGGGKWYILVFLGLLVSILFDVHTYGLI